MQSSDFQTLLRRSICGAWGALLLIALLSLFFCPPGAFASEYAKDTAAIAAAFVTHLTLHEMGHQVVAEEAEADSPRMQFFVRKNGKFYPGLSTYENIPKESKLSYALAGERMAGHTFEYALDSYHLEPTTYNKALMFFSCTDFLWYTLLANYVHDDNDTYDPNIVRKETGLSKEMLLSLVMVKSLMNAYRVYNKDARFIPSVVVYKSSVAFVIRYDF